MNKSAYILPATMLFYTGVALADMQPDFKKVDTNGDGVLSRQEINKSLDDVNFSEIDKNRDGAVDRKEYETVMKQGQQDQG